MNPYADPDNDIYDRDSDENFEIPEATSIDDGDDQIMQSECTDDIIDRKDVH